MYCYCHCCSVARRGRSLRDSQLSTFRPAHLDFSDPGQKTGGPLFLCTLLVGKKRLRVFSGGCCPLNSSLFTNESRCLLISLTLRTPCIVNCVIWLIIVGSKGSLDPCSLQRKDREKAMIISSKDALNYYIIEILSMEKLRYEFFCWKWYVIYAQQTMVFLGGRSATHLLRVKQYNTLPVFDKFQWGLSKKLKTDKLPLFSCDGPVEHEIQPYEQASRQAGRQRDKQTVPAWKETRDNLGAW